MTCFISAVVTCMVTVVLGHNFLLFFISSTGINDSDPTEFQFVYSDCSSVKHFNYEKNVWEVDSYLLT